MKFFILPFFILSTFFISGCGKEKAPPMPFAWNVDSARFDFAKYVDPMIGTAGHGHTFPGATAPFGMVQLSPDTRVDGSWDGCSGYHYDDDTIYGFSHTHLSGTGCSDYGDILFMPSRSIGDEDSLFRSHFSHTNEKAEAGFYSVLLDNFKTKVELTASPRVGVHRYTFENDGHNLIRLDLAHRDEVLEAHYEIVNDRTIKGYRFSKAWAQDQRVYFYAEFSRPFKRFPLNLPTQQTTRLDSSLKSLKPTFEFDYDGDEKHVVILKVALSAVSCENAKLNMESEVPGFDFDAVHKKVLQQWNSELGKIEVKSADETRKKIFYTALYHCFIAPNLYCDVNGDYRGRDNKIHSDTIHPQYTVFSLWDTYRALHPLFTIIQPKRDQDFINTFVKQSQEGDLLPVWELSANETNCMIGYHSVPVIVDAWMKGLTNFDTANAYEAMVASAMQDDRGLEAYKKYGFIPAEGESESVSKTLEYAYDDWCIALAAKRMKREDDYNYFMRRSQSWKNLYDPKTGFFRPRLNNSFVEPFDPAEVNFHLTEANAWQYSLAVQQDIPGLIEAHGGKQNFLTHLDKLFSASIKTSGRDQADITGLIGQYAQGNEPSHHMAYLYCYAGVPLLTQQKILEITKGMYTANPDGLCGNEDCGQMSAWYVLSAMGFYQVTPGTDKFIIGTPLFDEVILHLENGKTTKLQSQHKQLSDEFVIATKLNGKDWNKGWLSYADIIGGNTIEFRMSYNPLSLYETHFSGVANAYADDNRFLTPFPYVSPLAIAKDNFPNIPRVPLVLEASNHLSTEHFSTDRTFTKHMELLMMSQKEYYISINGGDFINYASGGHVDLYETSTLRTFSKNDSGICSDTIEFSYTKIPSDRFIKLNTAYANQYAAGGNRALIDGIRGSDNFRTGDWQGYEGKDIDAIIDLGSTKDVTHIAIGCLQDQNAWIFFPSEVIFYSSADGKNFTEIENNKNTFKQNSQTVLLHEFYTDKPIKARYIKVVAKNSGPCPAWHPGNGHPSWIFADEIIINSK
jgi:predicted alpha-1,2-mannosidase